MTSRAISAGLERMSATGLTPKRVIFDSEDLGHATTWIGVDKILRERGLHRFCADLWRIGHETKTEFVICTARRAA